MLTSYPLFFCDILGKEHLDEEGQESKDSLHHLDLDFLPYPVHFREGGLHLPLQSLIVVDRTEEELVEDIRRTRIGIDQDSARSSAKLFRFLRPGSEFDQVVGEAVLVHPEEGIGLLARTRSVIVEIRYPLIGGVGKLIPVMGIIDDALHGMEGENQDMVMCHPV